MKFSTNYDAMTNEIQCKYHVIISIYYFSYNVILYKLNTRDSVEREIPGSPRVLLLLPHGGTTLFGVPLADCKWFI